MTFFIPIGFFPSQNQFFPTGMHNLFHEKLRKYIPTHKYTVSPLIISPVDQSPITYFPFGYKLAPDHMFTSDSKKMYKAIVDKDFKSLENLIDQGFDLNTVILKDYGYTALGLAASLNFIEIVHYLNMRKADLDYQMGPFKKTALHLAVEYNAELTIKFLLKHGAKIETKDIFGFDIYEQAENRGNFALLTLFDKFKDQKRERDIVEYNSVKYQGPFPLENMFTSELKFRPSSLMEFHYNYFTEDLDKFYLYTLNDFKMDYLPKHPSSLPRDPILGSDFFSKMKYTYDESLLI